MAFGGRCYSARAGRLEEAFVYARRAHEAGDVLDNAQLRALRAMEAEPYLYQGDWNAAIEVAERALPAAWEIREWLVVGCASAWLAMSYLKLGKIDDARRVLDRVFKEAPLRAAVSMACMVSCCRGSPLPSSTLPPATPAKL